VSQIILVLSLLGAFAKLRKATFRHVRPSVCPHATTRSHWTDFRETWHFSVFPKSVEKIQVSLKLDKNNGYLYVDQFTILIIARSVLLRMRNVSEKSRRENQNTHFVFSNLFFENRAARDTVWKNNVQPDRPRMTIWCMCIACWVAKDQAHTQNL